MRKRVLLLWMTFLFVSFLNAQEKLILGVDLSTMQQLENCTDLRYSRQDPQSGYEIFKQEGARLVRLRVWVNPSEGRSGAAEVVEACRRIKAANDNTNTGNGQLDVMINFHYSDYWADPKVQWIPEMWRTEIDGISDLREKWRVAARKVYKHTRDVLDAIADTEVNVAYVQVGNETDSGISDRFATENRSWEAEGALDRASLLIKAGVNGVKDSRASNAKIIVHHSDTSTLEDWFQYITNIDDEFTLKASDVDVIGCSYYPTFHKWRGVNPISIENLKFYIENTILTHNKDVMVVETAYPFTDEFYDNLRNNINHADIFGNDEISRDGQYNWYNELSNAVASSGGIGVISWEPGWVSSGFETSCTRVPVGGSLGNDGERRVLEVGSSMENCAFFDNGGVVNTNGGFRWLNANKTGSGYNVVKPNLDRSVPYGKTIAIRKTAGSKDWLQTNTSISGVSGFNIIAANGGTSTNDTWRAWKTFYVERYNGSNDVRIKSISSDGYWQHVYNNEDEPIRATGQDLNWQQRLQWYPAFDTAGGFALRTSGNDGKFLQYNEAAESPQYRMLYAKSTIIGSWETFTYRVLLSGKELDLKEKSLSTEVYPNPVNQGESINIDTVLPEEGTVNVTIYTIQGVLVYENHGEDVPRGATLNISSINFNPGMYIVNVISNGISETVKIVVQ